jgi:hypothetical protein
VNRPGKRALSLVCGLLFAALASAGEDRTNPEIQYLLDYVAASGCAFLRNGDAHDAADAADHLRLKYNRGRRYADTAEQFIDRLASQSSWSGKPYTVTCDATTEPSADWLHRALAEHRHQQP